MYSQAVERMSTKLACLGHYYWRRERAQVENAIADKYISLLNKEQLVIDGMGELTQEIEVTLISSQHGQRCSDRQSLPSGS